MANDPNNLSDIIAVDAKFLPPTATGVFGFSDPIVVAAFDSTPSFSGRIQAYTGSLLSKQTALINDGFGPTSATYLQVTSAGQQEGPPETIYVGRRDAGDADWPTALDAIKVEADTKSFGYYALAVDTRDSFDIEDIENWADTQFVFYLAQTASAAVRNNTPGNVAEIILAKNRINPRTAIIYHQPDIASNLAGAILTSDPGDFNVADDATLTLRVDGGLEQAFDFNATAAFVLGSIAETFVFADGDELAFSVDGAAVQTIAFETSSAQLFSGVSEFYDIIPGSILNIRTDGGAVQPVTFAATAGEDTTSAETWVIAAGETVEIAVDGGANQLFTFALGTITPGAATASEVAAVWSGVSGFTGVAIINNGTTVTIRSLRSGLSSDIEIVSGTAIAALGLVVGNNPGTGFANFADTATALEVATQINTDTADLVASDNGGRVKLLADSIGTDSRLQVLGGAPNSALQFDTNEVSGEGDFADATAATADEVLDVLVEGANGAVITNVAGAIQITSRRLGTGSNVTINASTVATALGLAVGPAVGTGDFFNAASATASEIATHIGLTLTDATASTKSNAVVLTTDAVGADAELEITGGTLADALNFTDSAGNSGRARGTGVSEDYLDCAWIGRCITFKLDETTASGGGQSTWDDHHLIGVFADKDITENERQVLEETLKVNTYRNRNGRDETHTGTLCNDNLGGGRYIDVRTTLDWFKARTVETFKRTFDEKADLKLKLAYSDDQAIAELANEWRGLHARAEANGHIFFQDKDLDRSDPKSVGLFIPTTASQTQTNKDNRLIADFQTRQPIQAAAQRAKATIELVGPTG